MKKNEIEIGGTYLTKVGGRGVEVRIDRANPRGGWEATSLGTNKKIRLKPGQSLTRAEAEAGKPAKPKAPAGKPTRAPAAGRKRGKGQDTPGTPEEAIPAAVAPLPESVEHAASDGSEAPPPADEAPLPAQSRQPAAPPAEPTAAETVADNTLDPVEPAAAADSAGGQVAGPDPAPPDAKAKATGRTKAGMSCLDAAAEVLQAAGSPMQCKAMIASMAEKGLWTSNAPTPAATLYSAILREITTKGAGARFKKTDRGHFALTA